MAINLQKPSTRFNPHPHRGTAWERIQAAENELAAYAQPPPAQLDRLRTLLALVRQALTDWPGDPAGEYNDLLDRLAALQAEIKVLENEGAAHG